MPDKPPKARLPDNFASFEASARGHGTRRKARWALSPLRDVARASAESARFSNLEGELRACLGRKPVKE
jgi:hypothetical protein